MCFKYNLNKEIHEAVRDFSSTQNTAVEFRDYFHVLFRTLVISHIQSTRHGFIILPVKVRKIRLV